MNGYGLVWRWMFVALAASTSLLFLAAPPERWLPIGMRIPAIIIQIGAALNLLGFFGVLLGKQWGYIAALVATLATSIVASWMFFGYPKHTPQASFVAAWIICLIFQLLPGVKDQFMSETK